VEIVKRLFETSPDLAKDGLLIISKDFYKGKGNSIKPKNSKAQEFLKLFKEAGILDKITTSGILEKDEHAVLLSNASAYISFASFEGFPYWNLGAIASGIPVIVNSNNVNKEIFKLAVLTVDLKNFDEDAKLISEYLNNKEKVSSTLEIANSLLEKLSWEKTAEKTWGKIKGIVS
jgi:glycosyltransferase involved in cell wall biosynthesis